MASSEQKAAALSGDLEAERHITASKETLMKDLETEMENLRQKLESWDAESSQKAKQPAIGDVEAANAALEKAKDRISDLELNLKEMEELFNSRLEASISEHVRTQESLDSQRLVEREQFEKLETERNAAYEEKAAMEQELDLLKTRVADLVEELHEANDAMQLHVTNEVSDLATELAVEALRESLEEMRVQAESDQRDCLAEKQARSRAEQEVQLLRSDLAALLGMEDTAENHANMQKLTLEAKSKLQTKEIAEIEDLKTSLAAAVEELSSARLAEKMAKELAAKSETQATMYEHELVAAKSDLKFLTDTMDEMREAESTRRSSLEYRLSSLENDNDVLRRFHSAEMENLRSELNQISMERDRLFQALKESEKSKDALLRAKGGTSSGIMEADLMAEMELLRLEKAELLSAAAEEGSRLERRLHEAVSAAKSSFEADLIVEKELRVAAEKALENFKLEVKSEVFSSKNDANAASDKEKSALENETMALKSQIALLVKEKEQIEVRLAAWKREADEKGRKLAEECRTAKAHVIQLEREGRYRAEIRDEVSRLQTHVNGGGRAEIRVNVDPAEADGAEESTKISKLAMIIQQQKEAIEEERSVYFDLLTEHDDLLALLAQQDLLKESLMSALTRIGDESAVEAAVQEAEEKAVAQYGKYVKLT